MIAPLGLYQSEYECPRCGCGSKDLKPELLAQVVYAGFALRLRCQICEKEFLIIENVEVA